MKVGEKYKSPTGWIWEVLAIMQNDVFMQHQSPLMTQWVTKTLLNNTYTKVDDDPQVDLAFWDTGAGTFTLPKGFTIDEVYVGEKQCFHDWKQYTGFTESYEYCTKCDKKKVNNG